MSIFFDYIKQNYKEENRHKRVILAFIALTSQMSLFINCTSIADKRRASWALARSKIKSKSQITTEKDVELTKIKEENLQLKESANKKEEIQPAIPEIVKKPVKVCNTPIRQRPKNKKYIKNHNKYNNNHR